MYSPFLLSNIEIACKRIKEAINNNEKICISYDADLDGCCSGTIMMRYLKLFTNNITYVYSKREKGHGISNQKIPLDINLLIITDSSSNEVKECEKLKDKNIDIIIIDHHPITEINNYAIIINPYLNSYPNKELSGSAVCFKCCEILDTLMDAFYAYDFIDLACIGLQGDVMSMSELENRFLIYQGLHNIKNPGIKAIIKKAGIFDINSQTISYKIAPIINAITRTNKIEKAIELLLEDDTDHCLVLAKECIALNEERKKTQAKLFTKVKDRIDLSHKIIIVETSEKDKITKGYNGLLAAQIADHYKKPTLVVKNHEETCAGSGRGIGNIQLKELLQETNLFESLEGHPQAMGVQFKKENLEDIYTYVDEKLENEDKQQNENVLYYDLEIDKEDINKKLIKQIQQYNYITGKKCEPTKFVIRNLPIEEVKIMGKTLDTVKIVTPVLDCIKFKTNELWADMLNVGDTIDVIGSLNINKWYNFGIKCIVETEQMLLDDCKIVKIM